MFQQSAIIQNFNSTEVGVKEGPIIYRCRGCNNNLTSNDPASQYQRQKIIQNTVRVPASLFTMNLGALNAYERPNLDYKVVDVSGSNYVVSPGVNWNQMSDRKDPHIQVVKTGSGSGYGASSTKRTITRDRPGAMSPGGSGVDIKHNSYDRYLNRLKAKKPIRRGEIPPTFGAPYIPFNRADPIYGGKVMKTSIVNNCNCPIVSNDNVKLYANSSIQNQIYDVTYKYSVFDFVFAKKLGDGSGEKFKAQILGIENGIYTVKFEDGTIEQLTELYLSIYFDCNCISSSDSLAYIEASLTFQCKLISDLSQG
jgi:hypothetical protein